MRRRAGRASQGRAGDPNVSRFNTDDTKKKYNASEPVNDRRKISVRPQASSPTPTF
jgi:hypothetical protein